MPLVGYLYDAYHDERSLEHKVFIYYDQYKRLNYISHLTNLSLCYGIVNTPKVLPTSPSISFIYVLSVT